MTRKAIQKMGFPIASQRVHNPRLDDDDENKNGQLRTSHCIPMTDNYHVSE